MSSAPPNATTSSSRDVSLARGKQGDLEASGAKQSRKGNVEAKTCQQNNEVLAKLPKASESRSVVTDATKKTSKIIQGSPRLRPLAPKKRVWEYLLRNEYLHRARKVQHPDEVLVCQCRASTKPGSEGADRGCQQERALPMGCGEQCLNRMVAIECEPTTCPCGSLCSNQRFQKRRYPRMSVQWYGKKGYGLRAEEDIEPGRFIIEYVGEVLNERQFVLRLQQYTHEKHRHYYFMTLNGTEVIDARRKGNLSRFMNHSCEPNCCLEKWVVNAELCIGVFAMKAIKKGDEMTFDYNYERFGSARPTPCYCLSRCCRGVLGAARKVPRKLRDELLKGQPFLRLNGEGAGLLNVVHEGQVASEVGHKLAGAISEASNQQRFHAEGAGFRSHGEDEDGLSDGEGRYEEIEGKVWGSEECVVEVRSGGLLGAWEEDEVADFRARVCYRADECGRPGNGKVRQRRSHCTDLKLDEDDLPFEEELLADSEDGDEDEDELDDEEGEEEETDEEEVEELEEEEVATGWEHEAEGYRDGEEMEDDIEVAGGDAMEDEEEEPDWFYSSDSDSERLMDEEEQEILRAVEEDLERERMARGQSRGTLLEDGESRRGEKVGREMQAGQAVRAKDKSAWPGSVNVSPVSRIQGHRAQEKPHGSFGPQMKMLAFRGCGRSAMSHPHARNETGAGLAGSSQVTQSRSGCSERMLNPKDRQSTELDSQFSTQWGSWGSRKTRSAPRKKCGPVSGLVPESKMQQDVRLSAPEDPIAVVSSLKTAKIPDGMALESGDTKAGALSLQGGRERTSKSDHLIRSAESTGVTEADRQKCLVSGCKNSFLCADLGHVRAVARSQGSPTAPGDCNAANTTDFKGKSSKKKTFFHRADPCPGDWMSTDAGVISVVLALQCPQGSGNLESSLSSEQQRGLADHAVCAVAMPDASSDVPQTQGLMQIHDFSMQHRSKRTQAQRKARDLPPPLWFLEKKGFRVQAETCASRKVLSGGSKKPRRKVILGDDEDDISESDAEGPGDLVVGGDSVDLTAQPPAAVQGQPPQEPPQGLVDLEALLQLEPDSRTKMGATELARSTEMSSFPVVQGMSGQVIGGGEPQCERRPCGQAPGDPNQENAQSDGQAGFPQSLRAELLNTMGTLFVPDDFKTSMGDSPSRRNAGSCGSTFSNLCSADALEVISCGKFSPKVVVNSNRSQRAGEGCGKRKFDGGDTQVKKQAKADRAAAVAAAAAAGCYNYFHSDVVESLERLLAPDEGLKKTKVVAQSYLRLLMRVVCCGDIGKPDTGIPFSAKGLSVLLGVLLKTSSPTLLSRILSLNGLGVLLILLRKLQSHWECVAVLRKLLRVLIHLQMSGALQLALSCGNNGSLFNSARSFTSLLAELRSQHRDAEVGRLAASLCNLWMQAPVGSVCMAAVNPSAAPSCSSKPSSPECHPSNPSTTSMPASSASLPSMCSSSVKSCISAAAGAVSSAWVSGGKGLDQVAPFRSSKALEEEMGIDKVHADAVVGEDTRHDRSSLRMPHWSRRRGELRPELSDESRMNCARLEDPAKKSPRVAPRRERRWRHLSLPTNTPATTFHGAASTFGQRSEGLDPTKDSHQVPAASSDVACGQHLEGLERLRGRQWLRLRDRRLFFREKSRGLGSFAGNKYMVEAELRRRAGPNECTPRVCESLQNSVRIVRADPSGSPRPFGRRHLVGADLLESKLPEALRLQATAPCAADVATWGRPRGSEFRCLTPEETSGGDVAAGQRKCGEECKCVACHCLPAAAAAGHSGVSAGLQSTLCGVRLSSDELPGKSIFPYSKDRQDSPWNGRPSASAADGWRSSVGSQGNLKAGLSSGGDVDSLGARIQNGGCARSSSFAKSALSSAIVASEKAAPIYRWRTLSVAAVQGEAGVTWEHYVFAADADRTVLNMGRAQDESGKRCVPEDGAEQGPGAVYQKAGMVDLCCQAFAGGSVLWSEEFHPAAGGQQTASDVYADAAEPLPSPWPEPPCHPPPHPPSPPPDTPSPAPPPDPPLDDVLRVPSIQSEVPVRGPVISEPKEPPPPPPSSPPPCEPPEPPLDPCPQLLEPPLHLCPPWSPEPPLALSPPRPPEPPLDLCPQPPEPPHDLCPPQPPEPPGAPPEEPSAGLPPPPPPAHEEPYPEPHSPCASPLCSGSAASTGCVTSGPPNSFVPTVPALPLKCNWTVRVLPEDLPSPSCKPRIAAAESDAKVAATMSSTEAAARGNLESGDAVDAFTLTPMPSVLIAEGCAALACPSQGLKLPWKLSVVDNGLPADNRRLSNQELSVAGCNTQEPVHVRAYALQGWTSGLASSSLGRGRTEHFQQVTGPSDPTRAAHYVPQQSRSDMTPTLPSTYEVPKSVQPAAPGRLQFQWKVKTVSAFQSGSAM